MLQWSPGARARPPPLKTGWERWRKRRLKYQPQAVPLASQARLPSLYHSRQGSAPVVPAMRAAAPHTVPGGGEGKAGGVKRASSLRQLRACHPWPTAAHLACAQASPDEEWRTAVWAAVAVLYQPALLAAAQPGCRDRRCRHWRPPGGGGGGRQQRCSSLSEERQHRTLLSDPVEPAQAYWARPPHGASARSPSVLPERLRRYMRLLDDAAN